jgi:hypothetical protein
MRPVITPAAPERGGIVLILLAILATLVLVGAGYLWFVLHWSYSEGDRAGVLQKLSRKGWVCKTWEGELAQYVVPGVAPTIWNFSVRDDDVAAQLQAAIGAWVALHYTEHKGIPTRFFGETGYFVRAVRIERKAPPELPLPGQQPLQPTAPDLGGSRQAIPGAPPK